MNKNTPIPNPRTLQRLRQISHLLDNAIPIPGTKYRIGIDPILGLLPGGGDLAGGILSAYIVYHSAKLGVPQETLVKMVSNILVEVMAGSVPVVGDVVDVAWKANVKNIELLEIHLQIPAQKPKANPWFVFFLLTGLLLIILLVAGVSILAITSIIRLVTGS